MIKRGYRLELAVQYASRDDDLPARPLLRRWLAAALERDAAVTLRFVDTEEGKALNKTYRQRSGATNVLSFVYDDDRGEVRGDIVLCVPVIRREAALQRKTMNAHCAHLVVHGMLHLQGYDHARTADAARMESREGTILAALGFPDPYRVPAAMPSRPRR